MYRPLPKQLTIKKSKIDGLGIFATEKIEAGCDLGITHRKIEPTALYGDDLIRTPLGGFLNHSDTPNCFIQRKGKIGTLYTIRPIKANEELTVFYTLYDV